MDTLTGRLGPREIALAAAFGVLIGLIPKANLLVLVLGILFFLSHANILLGILVMVAVSLLTPWIHPLCHRIGGDILSSAIGQEWAGQLFRIPVMPWTMLDNTVVLGSFLLGLVLFLPVFLLVWVPVKIFWPKKTPEDDAET